MSSFGWLVNEGRLCLTGHQVHYTIADVNKWGSQRYFQDQSQGNWNGGLISDVVLGYTIIFGHIVS